MNSVVRCVSRCRTSGFSLVEIMVTMVVGLFLMSGIIQIYTTSNQTYRVEESLARLQESGRFAVDFISRDIRNIDFAGCAPSGISSITNHLDAADADYDSTIHDFSNPLAASNGSGSASDTITVQRATGAGKALQSPMTNQSSSITVESNNGFQQNDIVLIADCNQGDIFQVTNDPSTGNVISHGVSGGSGPGNATATLSKAYGTDARVYPVTTTTYTIASGISGENSLFRSINEIGNGDELVDGVENMQILYGADSNGDSSPDYFVSSGMAGLDLTQVISVRVSLLLSTGDYIATKPAAYTYNGATVTPADQKLRRVFTTTIALRNRLP